MVTDDQQSASHDRRSDLVDISSLGIDEVEALPMTVFGESLRRIFAELDSDVEPVAGFQSGP